MADDTTGLTGLGRKRLRIAELTNERSSWVSHWREISEYNQPRAGRFFVTDHNKGDKRHHSIHDRTAIGASRTLSAGLMSGMTSPARPWFRLTLSDVELRERIAVKSWLHRTTLLLREIFSKSNTYRALQQGYGELGLFGTWATIVLPDFDNVMHHYPLTVGEYCIATNEKGVVDTLSREYEMAVGQIVAQFGRGNCSHTVQRLFDNNKLNAWVPVSHLIEPNPARDGGKMDNRNMRWSSCYFEPGRDSNQYLRESGFKRFPVLAPRWDVTSNDVYGHSPGMECLGDVKQLQFEQLRKAQAIDYQVNPPLQVPTNYKESQTSRLPGGTMYYDAASPTGGIRSAFEVNLDLNALREDIVDVRERIRAAYYEDLFKMLANDTRSGITATEVAERHEEKLLMLGPVLERLNNELLAPKIDLAFEFAQDAGLFNPTLPNGQPNPLAPPPELENVDLNIDFISLLHQAQRIVAAQSTDRLLASVGSMAALWPEVRHKINALQVVDDYADTYGVNPEIVRDDEQVAELMAQEAQAAQAAQMAAAAPVMADTAKTVGDINANNMRDVLGGLMGYGSPTSQEV